MYTTAVVRAAVVRAAVVHAAVVRAYDGCCSCIRRTTVVIRAYDLDKARRTNEQQLSFV